MLFLISLVLLLNSTFTFFFSINYLKKDILDPIPYILIINWLYFPLRTFFLILFNFRDTTRSVHFFEAYTNENILYMTVVSFISVLIIIISVSIISLDRLKINNIFKNFEFNFLIVHIINFFVLFILFSKYFFGFTHYFGNNLVNLTSLLNKYLSYFGSLGPITYTFTIFIILSRNIKTKLDYVLIFIFLLVYSAYYLIFGGLDGIISLVLPFIIYKLKDLSFSLKKILPIILILSVVFYFGVLIKKFTRVFRGSLNNTELNFSIIDFLINLSNRFHGADSFLALLYRLEIKETFYLYGEMFYLFFAGLIPRVIWESKPEISLGTTFNDFIWKPEIAQQIGYGYQSTAMLLQTEFYWNYSLLGVLFGFIMFTITIQIIKKLFYNNYRENLFSLAFLSYSFSSVIRHEYSFASFLHGLIFIIIYFNIYYFLVSRK